MMIRIHHMLKFMLLVGILTTAAVAQAKLAPPVKFTWAETPQSARNGETFRGRLQVIAGAELDLIDLRIHGKNWSGLRWDASTELLLSAGDTLTVNVSGVPQAGFGLLEVSGQIGEKTIRRKFDVSAVTMSAPRTQLGVDMTSAGEVVHEQKRLPRDPRLAPAKPPVNYDSKLAERTIVDESDDISVGGKAARVITVRGQVKYRLPDGTEKPAHGATAMVYDEDTGPDEFLGSDVTDNEGWFEATFTWDPCWACDTRPDLYVRVETANSRVDVEHPVFEYTYSFETPTWSDYEGSSLFIGARGFAAEDSQPYLFLLTHGTRVFNMIDAVSNRVTDTVDIQFPENVSTSYYVGFFEEIHIGNDDGFSVGTLAHEYGHHFIENFGDKGSIEYCNGFCDAGYDFIDDAIVGCGHCSWCEETSAVAWSEGWSDWLSDFYARYHNQAYGYTPLNPYSYEKLVACWEDDIFADPYITEGNFAALLRDMEDTTQDDDPHTAGFADSMSDDAVRIFAVADLNEPTTSLQFINAYRSRYSPQEPDFWLTARNNGFQYDFLPPGVVSDLESFTHTPGLGSAVSSISMGWLHAPDDASGVEDYSVAVTLNAPQLPNPAVNVSGSRTWRSSQLVPGVYYVSVRARDRAGNWSGNYMQAGPYVVIAATPPNIVIGDKTGWAERVVPRSVNDSGFQTVPAPTILYGDVRQTWWNVNLWNMGQSLAQAGTVVQVFLDGTFFYSPPWDPVEHTAAAGAINEASTEVLNKGPLNIRGGRHMFTAEADIYDLVEESNELDNTAGRSWVWQPATLAVGETVVRPSPPDPIGGWEHHTSGPYAYNADGLRFLARGGWHALAVSPYLPGADTDVRLHPSSTGPEDGFLASEAWSGRGPGKTDAVAVTGYLLWDAAILQAGVASEAGQYFARHINTVYQAFGDTVQVDMELDEMLALRGVNVPSSALGELDVILTSDPAQGPLTLLWWDASYARVDLHDYEVRAVTDSTGTLRVRAPAPATGTYCAVVYRDADDGNGLEPESFSLYIGIPAPDVVAVTPAQWPSPLVTWEDTDDLYGPIPQGATLPGWDETVFHSATRNVSPTAIIDQFEHQIWVDDTMIGSTTWPTGYAGDDSVRSAFAYTEVPGGRHTVALTASYLNAEVRDAQYDDNFWAAQWVWTPGLLQQDVPRFDPSPPGQTAGWANFRNPTQTVPPLFYNSNGYRTPVLTGFGGQWTAITVMPRSGLTDVDLRLYDELSQGSTSGFAGSVLTSTLGGPGQPEFLIVQPDSFGAHEFDLGVLRGPLDLNDNAGYDIVLTNSMGLILDAEQQGEYGPETLASGHSLALYQVWLEAGNVRVELTNLDSQANLGLSVHGGGSVFSRGSQAGTSETAWIEAEGQDEQILMSIPVAGSYAIAVWKVGVAERLRDSSFNLGIFRGSVSAAPESIVPVRTALQGIHPNPFNPRTTVVFQMHQAGMAEIAVYDLRGSMVRVLQSGQIEAGRHEILWQGTDGDGRAVPSGLYFVRLRANGVSDIRKMTLVR